MQKSKKYGFFKRFFLFLGTKDCIMPLMKKMLLCSAVVLPLALPSCQLQPLDARFIKQIDGRHKTIAMPLNAGNVPYKLTAFKEALRADGWRIIVSGATEANGAVRHANASAKYTLMGEIVGGERPPLSTLLIGGAAAYFLQGDAAYVNFTLTESATGEEVMTLNGRANSWRPSRTVEQMRENTR